MNLGLKVLSYAGVLFEVLKFLRKCGIEEDDLNIYGLLVTTLVPKCLPDPLAVDFMSTSSRLHY